MCSKIAGHYKRPQDLDGRLTSRFAMPMAVDRTLVLFFAPSLSACAAVYELKLMPAAACPAADPLSLLTTRSATQRRLVVPTRAHMTYFVMRHPHAGIEFMCGHGFGGAAGTAGGRGQDSAQAAAERERDLSESVSTLDKPPNLMYNDRLAVSCN